MKPQQTAELCSNETRNKWLLPSQGSVYQPGEQNPLNGAVGTPGSEVVAISGEGYVAVTLSDISLVLLSIEIWKDT